MSNAGSFGKLNWIAEGGEDLVGASTAGIEWATGDGDVTFGNPDAGDGSDFHIPRFITCNVAGVLVCTGWSDSEAAIERNLVVGQVLPFRPKSLTASGSTAEVILEY
jgi:hypothetical protein